MFQTRPTQGKPAYGWKRVLSKKEFRNQEPGGRAGHVQFTLSSKDARFWVHGGQAEGGAYSNELFCFDTVKKVWSKHKLLNEPTARAYHRVCMCTPTTEVLIEKGKKALPRVLLYGGIEKGQLKKEISLLKQWTAFNNKSSFLNPRNTTSWKQSDDDFKVGGSVPLPRCNHTMTTLDTGQHILVFGGWHGRFVNDLYLLNTEHMTWTLKKAKNNPRASVEFKITPRAGHTACFVKTQIFDRGPEGTFQGPALVCFGGQTDGGMQLDEVLVLDLTNWEWHRPRPQGREPVARSGHSAVLVDQERIVVFGGWDGGKVSACALRTAAFVLSPNDCRSKLALVLTFRLHSLYKVRDDVHVLQIAGDMYNDWCWQDQIVRGAKVEGRIGHSAVHMNGEMFVFGGIGKDQRLLPDLNVLDIPKIVVDKSNLSTADRVPGVEDQDLVARIKRNQVLSQQDVEKDLDTKLDEAVQRVSQKIEVVNARQREEEETFAAAVAQNLREAKQKSVFQLVQNHGKTLEDAMDIANGFNPEQSNALINVESAAREIVSGYDKPQPPRDRVAKPWTGNSAWHDAIIGGVEQVALEQIAVNGGLMKTWGALIDEGEDSEEEEEDLVLQATQAAEEEVDIQKATRYENIVEKELKGESLEQLVQQQTEREFAFKQQMRKDLHKSTHKQNTSSPNRRPKRLVNVLGEAPLALTSGSMSDELAKIVSHGAVSTRTYSEGDTAAIMSSLPKSDKAVPRGIIDSAMKIKALFMANMYRRRFERLRAIVRIQAHVRRFITILRLKREQTLAAQAAQAVEAQASTSGSGARSRSKSPSSSKKKKKSKASAKGKKKKKKEKKGFGSTQNK